MPRLKDFKIRVKNNKYYEIRFRRYGYNVSFSSTNFEEAKRKAFSWLNLFEQEIKINCNFAVVRATEKGDGGKNKKNMIFGPFALSYMENVKKRSLGNITSSVYTHFSMEFQKEQAVKLKYII